MTTDKAEIKEGERIDDLELSGLSILQNPSRFCFGMDAVLLSGFVRASEGDICLDIGCGGGIIPILMSAKTQAAHLTGIELQEDMADMARRSVALNALGDKIDIVTGDARRLSEYFPPSHFDVITSNPPYMKAEHGMINSDDSVSVARHELYLTLDELAGGVAYALRSGGHFFMVHRPFRLVEIMCTLREHSLEPKRMRLVYPYIDRDPNMVLLEAVRGGKPRMQVEKPLVVFESEGVYSEEMVRDYGF